MRHAFIRSRRFWSVFIVSALSLSAFFLWELGFLVLPFLPVLPRPLPTLLEKEFAVLMILLLSFDTGLLSWHLKRGTCPVGARSVATLSGALGFVALLCPVCLILPFTLIGLSVSLVFLAPYLPLLRVIVIFLLIATTVILLPKKKK